MTLQGEHLVIPPCKVMYAFDGYFMRFSHLGQKRIDIRMPGGNRRIALCHGHDFANLIAGILRVPDINKIPVFVFINQGVAPCVPRKSEELIRNQPSRHGLSALDHRLRQAVAVVKHYLFHGLH